MADRNDSLRPSLRLGLMSSILLVAFEVAYALALVLGLSARAAARDPVGDPYFTMMELLIIAMAPAIVILPVAVHGFCARGRKCYALAALAFATGLATITSCVHASILLLSRAPSFAGMPHVFAFEWPSLVYVLDVVAWDFFFGFFAIFLGLSFDRTGVQAWIRRLLVLSGLLAFAGLAGVITGNMSVRNIGIIGYVPVFTVAVALITEFVRKQLHNLP